MFGDLWKVNPSILGTPALSFGILRFKHSDFFCQFWLVNSDQTS